MHRAVNVRRQSSASAFTYPPPMDFAPIDPDDPLATIPVDACPECGAVMQDRGCSGCGYERPAPRHVERPTAGDDLPSIGGY